MIKNEKQLAISKQQLKKVEEAFNDIKTIEESNLRAKLHQKSLKATIETLSKEIYEYDSLKKNNLNVIHVKDFYDISKGLIKARIAKGWTQTDLARKMEIDVQQIQRYEARDYEGASIERIQEVIDALEIIVDVNINPIQKTAFPNNENLIVAQQKVYEKQSLFSFV